MFQIKKRRLLEFTSLLCEAKQFYKNNNTKKIILIVCFFVNNSFGIIFKK